MFDTQRELLKDFFKKVDLKKNRQTTKKDEKCPKGKELILKLHHWIFRSSYSTTVQTGTTCTVLSVR